MTASTPCCATCEHWSNVEAPIATAVRRPDGADIQLGICRKFPPILIEYGAGVISSQFPQTHGSRICGDWMPIFEGNDGSDPDDGERVINLSTERERRTAA